MVEPNLGFRTFITVTQTGPNKVDGGDEAKTAATLLEQWSGLDQEARTRYEADELACTKLLCIGLVKQVEATTAASRRSEGKSEEEPQAKRLKKSVSSVPKGVWDFRTCSMELAQIRSVLIRLEESIIFGLIERAQFSVNQSVYKKGALGSNLGESFLHHYLRENEIVAAKVRRYTSPDEYPFTPRSELPEPMLPPLEFPPSIVPSQHITVNDQIMDMYINEVVPSICAPGEDGNYGSTATCDVAVLQLLSKRIHYGKFVAEIKFRKQPEEYSAAIARKDANAISELITHQIVEDKLLKRVRDKAITYGTNAGQDDQPIIPPEKIEEIYKKLITLTKVVEVDYLLERLDSKP